MHLNPNIRRLVCSRSGAVVAEGSLSSPVGLCRCCPAPGRPVVVEYDFEKVRESRQSTVDSRQSPEKSPGKTEEADHLVFSDTVDCRLLTVNSPGIWKYAPLLPVHGVPEGYASDVGSTPIARSRGLSEENGVEVFCKNEGQNPSGSFKDRGLAVGIALGRALGAQRFCLPTQGNAGVAASLFSARLSLPGCLVYMPEGYQNGVYHKACELFGAEVRFFGQNIAAAGKKMREDLQGPLSRGEFVDMSTFFEPGRLEGKKTMGLEIAAHFGENLPEYILYPTGGGTGLVGIWKAFSELIALGALDPAKQRLPRMVVVQSERCAPVVEAFQKKLDQVVPVQSQGTIADGLDVPGAIMGHGMLQVLRESSGTAVAVSEEGIKGAFRRYGQLGINAGYESAATLAALKVLRASGEIPEGSRVLLLNTGSQLIPLAKATPSS